MASPSTSLESEKGRRSSSSSSSSAENKKKNEEEKEVSNESERLLAVDGAKKTKTKKKKKKTDQAKKKKKKKRRPFVSPLTSSRAVVPSERDERGIDDEDDPRDADVEGGGGSGRVYSDDDDSDDDGGRHRYERRKERRESKRRREEADDEEERRLTSLLFGRFDSGGGADDDFGVDGIGEARRKGEKKKKKKKGGQAGRREEADEDDDDERNEGWFELDRTGPSSSARAGERDDESASSSAEEKEDSSSSSSSSSESEDDDGEASPPPAWIDDDDRNVSVNLLRANRLKKLRCHRSETDPLTGHEYERRLRDRHSKTVGASARIDWARVPSSATSKTTIRTTTRRGGDSDPDEEEEGTTYDDAETKLLSSTASLLSSSDRIPPRHLSIVRRPDANLSHPSDATIQALHFHKGSNEDEPLMLAAGLDKTLRFYEVGGGDKGGEKIHGIHFPDLPIRSASFLGNTGNVVVSGRRPYFYLYDAVAGKVDSVPPIAGRYERSLETCVPSPDGRTLAFLGNDGYVILFDAKTKSWTADLKMNGTARAVTFDPDGDYVIASGGDGDVYKWDMRTRRCVDRFRNEDGTVVSSLASSTSKFLAVGAESGVVNLYDDAAAAASGRPFSSAGFDRKPVKSIMNLQTKIDVTKFNHDGNLLFLSSRHERDATKVLHVPTKTVYSNWPTQKTPLGYAWCADFSPKSKYLAIGNDKGRCLLYRLNHYHD